MAFCYAKQNEPYILRLLCVICSLTDSLYYIIYQKSTFYFKNFDFCNLYKSQFNHKVEFTHQQMHFY